MSVEIMLAPRPAHVAAAAVYDFDYFHDAGLLADPLGLIPGSPSSEGRAIAYGS